MSEQIQQEEHIIIDLDNLMLPRCRFEVVSSYKEKILIYQHVKHLGQLVMILKLRKMLLLNHILPLLYLPVLKHIWMNV